MDESGTTRNESGFNTFMDKEGNYQIPGSPREVLMSKPQTTHITNKDELLKIICRQIVEAYEVVTDETWEGKFAWHTDPETVRKGGMWSVMRSASNILSLMKCCHD